MLGRPHRSGALHWGWEPASAQDTIGHTPPSACVWRSKPVQKMDRVACSDTCRIERRTPDSLFTILSQVRARR